MEVPRFFIAGIKFHDLHKVISDISEGDELNLVPEPTNQYDSNAVKILLGDVMLGYVPKTFSAQVSAKLEADPDLCCTVTIVDPSARPWEQCQVWIHALDELDNFDEVDELDSEEDEKEE